MEVVLRIIPATLAMALSKRSPSFSLVTVLQALATSMAVLYKLLTFSFLPLIILPAADVMASTFSRHILPACTALRTFILYSAIGQQATYPTPQRSAHINALVNWLFRLDHLRLTDGNQASVPELARENIAGVTITCLLYTS